MVTQMNLVREIKTDRSPIRVDHTDVLAVSLNIIYV